MMGIIGLLSQNKEKLSDLVLANIEALSNDEGGSEPENEWWAIITPLMNGCRLTVLDNIIHLP